MESLQSQDNDTYRDTAYTARILELLLSILNLEDIHSKDIEIEL